MSEEIAFIHRKSEVYYQYGFIDIYFDISIKFLILLLFPLSLAERSFMINARTYPFSKPYILILLTVCNNISMKNVIELIKSVKSLKMLS